MKYLIYTAIFVTVCFGAGAQDLDSLKTKILKLEENQEIMRMRLSTSHKKFQTGTVLILSGALLTALDLAVFKKESESNDRKHNYRVTYGGAFLLATGVYFQIDSHKFLWMGSKRKR
jgi:hypothetical protein